MKARGVVAAVLLLSGVGCAVGPDFHRPAAPPDTSFTREPARETATADGQAQRFVEGQPVPGDWWKMFGSPALDATVARALAANPGLDAARATLRQNRELLKAGYGVFFPRVDAQAGATRERENQLPGIFPAETFSLFTVSGTVSYAIDLWGGQRRQVEELSAGVDSQRYALASATIMLESNVVDAVIARAGYADEVDATVATLVLFRTQVKMADAQAKGGVAPYSAVLSLESQVASTEATLPPLEEKVDQAVDLLASLTGSTPAAFGAPDVRLGDLRLPADVPLSIPSGLVRQRPDVLVAEATLHAANAGIGVASAAMLPNLTLTATFGVNGTTPGDLFSAANEIWSVGAGLVQPIFHGGTLEHQRRAAVEARNAVAAQYRQTVLAAFQQVADTLRALSHDADAVEAQTEAVDTAEKAMRLVDANYQAGIATYLQVLTSDTQYLQAKTAYVQALAQRLQDTVALYVALGGGWWNTPDSVSRAKG